MSVSIGPSGIGGKGNRQPAIRPRTADFRAYVHTDCIQLVNARNIHVHGGSVIRKRPTLPKSHDGPPRSPPPCGHPVEIRRRDKEHVLEYIKDSRHRNRQKT
jgi:hypothetical protein